MDAQPYQRLEELFLGALEREGRARVAYLDESCGADTELRAELDALLALEDVAGDFLEDSPFELVEGELAGDPELPAAPPVERIGAYRVHDVLGMGGMGVVYRAEQENPRRTVALKVIQPFLATPRLLRRFEHEAEVLGRLQHPGIAQIFEAGTADTGFGEQPFFAMELVDGASVTEYADREGLDLRGRLRLLAAVAAAIHHAHQRGVIHRDLKPSNVLVNAAGEPKILDFGVARVTDADVRADSLRTASGQVLGTLPYMSPEQVAGEADELDVRTDVYSLACIGYELLAGRLPYEIRGKPLPEAARILAVESPPALGALDPALRGDVETIFAKGLAREKERRYASAAELAADVERYLRDEPIVARPASAAYQLRKFARRHRALVAGALLAVVALTAGAGLALWQAARATTQRDRAQGAEELATRRLELAEAARAEEALARQAADEARAEEALARQAAEEARGEEALARAEADEARGEAERELAKARAAQAFLRDMLKAADPYQARGEDVTVTEVLAAAAERAAEELADEPEVRSLVQGTIGEDYILLGLFDEAEEHVRGALETRLELYGHSHPAVAESTQHLALVLERLGRVEEAEEQAREALALMRELHGEQDGRVAIALDVLARIVAFGGRYDEALDLHREALDLGTAIHGPESVAAARSLGSLGSVLVDLRRYDEAEEVLVPALAILRAADPPEPGLLSSTLNGLYQLHRDRGEVEPAEAYAREQLALDRGVLGEDHPWVALDLSALGSILHRRRQVAEAEELLREAYDRALRALEEGHPWVISIRSNLALVLSQTGQLDEAEGLQRQLIGDMIQSRGAKHPDVTFALGNHGMTLWRLGRLEEARGRLLEAAELRREVFPPGYTGLADSLLRLAALERVLGELESAEERLGEAIEVWTAGYGAEDMRVRFAEVALGRVRTAQGRHAEAEELLQPAFEFFERVYLPTSQVRCEALDALVELYDAWPRPEDSARYRALWEPPAKGPFFPSGRRDGWEEVDGEAGD